MRVLVVEDNDDVADGLTELLELRGYEVTRVSDGHQALFALDGRLRPHLILLDLMLPQMDGLTFRKRQLERAPEIARIPVLGWTAFDVEADFPVLRKGGTSIEELLQHVARHRRHISIRRLAIYAGLAAPAVALVKALLDWLRNRR